MIKKIAFLAIIIFFYFVSILYAGNYKGKKILYINSYHEGYNWSDGINDSINIVLKGTGAELKIVYMDTKRYKSEDFKKHAGLRAKQTIHKFKPDVVIASDDNASKYLIEPYFKDTNLPFVFCGVNWQAKSYGFPAKNVTGIVEVALLNKTVGLLRQYTKGDKLGMLIADVFSAKKDMENYTKILGLNFEKVYYVKTYKDWKYRFLSLQNEVDMMIIGRYSKIDDFDKESAKQFVLDNYKISSCAVGRYTIPYAVLGIEKVPEELGLWAAKTALKILDGTSPSDIPLARNKKGKLIINMKIANKLGIVFDPPVLSEAEIIK